MSSYIHLQTPRTARVYQTLPHEGDVDIVWIACHGYGMAVNRFLAWFDPLQRSEVSGTHAVYCPEGLSKFYWGEFTGRPVASWMTSDDRLAEIEDFSNYLDRVYAHIVEVHSRAKIVLLGFSQGAATIMRWTNSRRPAYDALVLWSGTPPEDIKYAPTAYYTDRQLLSYWGDADELVPWSRAVVRFAEVDVLFTHTSFAGGHRITSPALLELASLLKARL